MLHPLQIILDYIVAFTSCGLVAFFRNKKFGMYVGFFIACTVRFLASSLSGYIFFREYAPEAWNPILYTLAYNGGYIYAEFILTVIFISIPQVKAVIKAYKTN